MRIVIWCPLKWCPIWCLQVGLSYPYSPLSVTSNAIDIKKLRKRTVNCFQFALKFAYHGFMYCDWLIMRPSLPVIYCISDQFTSPIYHKPPLRFKPIFESSLYHEFST